MNEYTAGSATGIDLAALEQLARNRFNGGLSLTSEEALALIALARATPQHPDLITVAECERRILVAVKAEQDRLAKQTNEAISTLRDQYEGSPDHTPTGPGLSF